MVSKRLTTEITIAEEISDREEPPAIDPISARNDEEPKDSTEDVSQAKNNPKPSTSDDDLWESDFDSDEEFEDDRYQTLTKEAISEKVITDLKDLDDKQHFYKREIICHKEEVNDLNKQICLLTFSDKKISENEIKFNFTDSDRNYVFKNKEIVISRPKVTQNKKKISKKKVKDIKIHRISTTFDEFLQIVFGLDASLIDQQNCKLFFTEETQMRESRLQSYHTYVNAMIPFIMKELWADLKYNMKKAVESNRPNFQMTYQKDSDNNITCSHIPNKESIHSFKFGQMVVISYSKCSSNKNVCKDNAKDMKEIKRLGVIIQVKTKLFRKTDEHPLNPILKIQIDKCPEEEFIFEELNIYTNPMEEDFESISVFPLNCVQKYLLEARIVYELKEKAFNDIFQQILKPNYTNMNAGFAVNLSQFWSTHDDELFQKHKDAIQKAFEVCCCSVQFPNPECSKFVAIYGKRGTGKTEILIEAALQFLKFAEPKIQPLIVIAMDKELTQIIEGLKKDEIKVFHISGDGLDNSLSHKKHDIRRVIKKLDKKNAFDGLEDKIECFDRCLKYYKEEPIELSTKELHFKQSIERIVVDKILSETQVVIGSIKDVMNDERFNDMFNKPSQSPDKKSIEVALIDSAHLLTETELLTLLFSGVKSFVLCGDSYRDAISYEKSDSYFKRYVQTFWRTIRKESKDYTIVYLKETIDSLKRLEENKTRNLLNKQNNRFHNNYNHNQNRFGGNNNFRSKPKQPNKFQRAPANNYGSSFFDRFQNKRPMKNEPMKNESKTKQNNQFNASPHPTSSSAQWSDPYNPNDTPNAMITGIVPTLGANPSPRSSAYGSRMSYLEHNQNRHNERYFSSLDPFGGETSSGDNDPNRSGFGQTTQRFVSNPTRHKDYNLF